MSLSLIITTISIFLISFGFIVFEKFDKSLIAISWALLMVIIWILSPNEAIASINFDTIFLLLAMMLFVNIAEKSWIFSWMNVKIAFITRGRPFYIFLLFSILTAVLSAFLDNVTTVILLVPLTINLVKGMGRDPKPYVFAEIIFSNIGGALTLIGDPPNIIIWGAADLGFLSFILNLWIPILMSMVFAIIVFIIVFRKSLKPIKHSLVDLQIANMLIDKIAYTFHNKVLSKSFIIKVLLILVLTIIGFFVHHLINIPPYIVALSAAVILAISVSKKINIHESFSSAEWSTLFFFAWLFIMVEWVVKTWLLNNLSLWMVNSTTDLFILSILILWISWFISMILDNIPFVTVMIPVILWVQAKMPEVDLSILWWSLSLGACLGWNATIIGASSNVVSVDLAKKENVHISFLEYMKFSFPLTCWVLTLCSVYLYFIIN